MGGSDSAFFVFDMRILRLILVLAVLIGFPLGSWIYLNKGLKWRLAAQKETAVVGRLGAFSLEDQTGQAIHADDLRGRYYLLAEPGDEAGMDVIRKVHKQFSVREDYQTLVLYSGTPPLLEADSVLTIVRCLQGCEMLEREAFEGKYAAAIVDDSLRVRGRYLLGSEDEARALVMHMAVVLPIPKREKIELKRGEQN